MGKACKTLKTIHFSSVEQLCNTVCPLYLWIHMQGVSEVWMKSAYSKLAVMEDRLFMVLRHFMLGTWASVDFGLRGGSLYLGTTVQAFGLNGAQCTIDTAFYPQSLSKLLGVLFLFQPVDGSWLSTEKKEKSDFVLPGTWESKGRGTCLSRIRWFSAWSPLGSQTLYCVSPAEWSEINCKLSSLCLMEGSIGPHSNIFLMTKVSRNFLETNLSFAIIICVCVFVHTYIQIWEFCFSLCRVDKISIYYASGTVKSAFYTLPYFTLRLFCSSLCFYKWDLMAFKGWSQITT